MTRSALQRPAYLIPPPFGGLAPLGRLLSRKSTVSKPQDTGHVMLHMQLRYTQSPAEFRAEMTTIAQTVSDVPGLIWKLWAETGTGQAAATCLFTTRDLARRYVDAMRIHGPAGDPRYLDVSFRLMDVIGDASRATRAVI